MNIYVAGPMTGHAAYNVDAFRDVATAWTLAGHVVETPFDADSRVWKRHYGRAFDPYVDTCDYGDPLLREMFAEDIAVLLASDAVVVLPGWEQSKGATLECRIAAQFGIPILLAAHPSGSLSGCVRAATGSLWASPRQLPADGRPVERVLAGNGA
jgi:hypothetical protein